MQLNSHGIPCNIPMKFNAKVKVVSKPKSQAQNPFKRYAELTRIVGGVEQTVIGPVGTKEYNHALHQGFKIVQEWMAN